MIVTNNPYNARIIDLPLAVGKLRLKYSSRSTVETIPEALKRKHDNGQFLRIFHDAESTEHTLIRGSDGGIIAYHVPSAYLRQHGVKHRPLRHHRTYTRQEPPTTQGSIPRRGCI